jgi:hypothetical protein
VSFVDHRFAAAFSQWAVRGLVGMVCLVAVTFSVQTCQASCGDYVMLRGSHLKTNGERHNSHEESAEGLSVPAPKKLPCNNPACRGEVPQLPVPQAPPSGSSSEKPFALFNLSLTLDGDSPACDWLEASAHARPGFRSLLERPPSL